VGRREVKMYIDGDGTNPTINGTGTEDYIGNAWGLAEFSDLYQGCLVANDKDRQYGFYRFRVPDQVFFIRISRRRPKRWAIVMTPKSGN
jgi:hypothetical protein